MAAGLPVSDPQRVMWGGEGARPVRPTQPLLELVRFLRFLVTGKVK
jgi:hypothetical protein